MGCTFVMKPRRFSASFKIDMPRKEERSKLLVFATTESFFTLGRVIPTDFVWLYNRKFINFVHVKVSFLFDVQILSV